MLSIDREVAVIDGFFAATALAKDLTLVTRNVEDFASFGVPLFNPWTRNGSSRRYACCVIPEAIPASPGLGVLRVLARFDFRGAAMAASAGRFMASTISSSAAA